MAIVYKTCDTYNAQLNYTCDPCGGNELGGVRSLLLVKKGTTVTIPLDLTAITASINAGNIIVMASTRGTFDGGTPKMVTGFGSQKERLVGADYVLQAKVPNFASNAAFMGAVEKIDEWNLMFATETQMHVVSSAVNITTKAPVEEGLDTEVLWNVEAKWYSKTKPTITPLAPIVSLLKCFAIE